MQSAPMKRENLNLSFGIAIPLLICLISYWFCVYYPTIAAATRESGFEQWLGFFGTIIGAGVTLMAAVIAWLAVQQQIFAQRELYDKQQDELVRKEAQQHRIGKEAAKVILMSSAQAAALIHALIKCYLDEWPLRERQVLHQLVEQKYRHLATALSYFTAFEGWQALSGGDRISYMLLTTELNAIQTRYAIAELNSEMVFEVFVRSQVFYFERFRSFLQAFDTSLGRSYEEFYEGHFSETMRGFGRG
jgi:hypothetical protein